MLEPGDRAVISESNTSWDGVTGVISGYYSKSVFWFKPDLPNPNNSANNVIIPDYMLKSIEGDETPKFKYYQLSI